MSVSRAFAIAAAILAWSMLSVASALACDGDRFPCPMTPPHAEAQSKALGSPLSLRGFTQPGKNARAKTQESAPAEDTVVATPRGPKARAARAAAAAAAAQPVINSPAAQTTGVAFFETPFTDTVRVYASDEMTDLDLLAADDAQKPVQLVNAVEPAPRAVATVNIRPAAGPQSVTASPAQEPADASLLQRIIITFGGAFGAASAIRLFVG
jgi:hypothetical protein